MMGGDGWQWSQLCGHGENITAWNKNDFGRCFEQLAFACTTHALLAILSAYHFARHSHRQVLGPIPRSLTLHIRFALCVVLAALPLVALVLAYLYVEIHPSLADVITWGIKAASWLIHSGYIWRLCRLYHIHIRGHVIVVLSFLLTCASTAIQLRTSILNLLSEATHIITVDDYVTFTTNMLHLLYLLSLIPDSRPDLIENSGSIQNADGLQTESETAPLLQSQHRGRYGAVPLSTATPDQLGGGDENAGCLSRLTFWWVTPLLLKGSQQHLNSATDLFDLPSRLNIQRIEEKFLEIMHETTPQKARPEVLVDEVTDPYGDTPAPNSSSGDDVVISDGQRHKKKTLVSALNTAFGIEYYSIGVLKLLADGFTFVGPMLLNWLVTYMEDPTEPSWHGYVYAAGLFLSTFLGSMCSTHFNYLVQIVGLKIRAAIITSIYRKSVLASSVSLSTFSVGEIINFMSTDVDRIVNFCPSFHSFWSLPFQIAVALYLLHQQIGLAFLAGLVFAILLIPVNRWIAIKIAKLSTSMMSHKDGRVKVMNELLTGIRIIKFYLWENHFRNKIGKLRNAELASLRGRKYLDALCVYFWATTPVLISVLTFATYALLGHRLTAAKVFTSMALFNILIMPLNAFPWVLNGLMEAWVSVRRVQVFLQLPELDRSKYYTQSQPDASNDSAVTIHQAQFSWSLVGDQEHPTDHPSHGVSSVQSSAEDGHINSVASARRSTQKLININLNIPKGSIVGVVGTVGSGKSSLLSAITAEMQLEQGLVTVANLDDGFGLAAQEAWIQNASIKDNILFGKPYCDEKYAAVVEACALEDDLKVMPHGDETEVGENGVTLSGGQKARVALARAVYQDKDLYLLDDPLAAVDAHVAHHLFHKCIMGLLKTKTRVLCTHHTKYLRDVDLVVVMKQGTIVNSGIPADILGADDLDITANANNSADDTTENKAEDVTADQEQCTGSSSLMQEEEKDTGVVKLHVYKSYWIAVGRILAPMILVSLLLMQGTRNISDWWLSYWVTHSHSPSADHNTSVHPSLSLTLTHGHTHFLYRHTSMSISPWSNLTESEDNVAYYLAVYGILAGANSFFTLVRAFLFAYGGICAAVKIHKLLLARILKAPVGFFDVTPIGRIMNRFSTDLYSIDDSLPFIMNTLCAQSYGLLGTLVITCYGLPWFSLLLVPLGIIYYFIQRYYRQTSREIKRITSVTLSPIYAHFSESITGLTTIRALRETDRFQAENRWRLEQNQRAQFTSQAASQWLGIRLQMIGVAMVTGVALIAVLEHHFRTVNPGLVGLAVSYALSVTGLLNGVVTAFTETEKQMVSVERAGEYITTTPTEKDWAILCAPPYWPIQGAIVFQRVFLRYRPSLPCALSGVCFETKPAEKIGIVGRTGSGKSSLFLALFRIVELEEGQVLIDGINVSHVPLGDLRSRLAIIPQDPFLFSGSVRENLDPEGFCHEAELWDTLQRCYLKDVVERLGGLDAQVAERGRHFSVGQRQLLCLARALLLRAKVLCIDEATASVDRQTDKLIQVTIREQFSDNTVLTIAHRTDTILDSDRVLVMHDGKVVEFAPPGILMQNEKSMFYGLVRGNT